MVMAMGATVLAFTPTRRAVFGEGISEAILLPTLIREATASAADYQVVPGLANADQSVIDTADLEASRVAFLFDGDKSGRERSKAFRRRGIPADRMVLLGMPAYRDLEIEDLVKASAFRSAVNAELRIWTSSQLPLSRVSNRGRIDALQAWCESEQIDVPDKKRVATQILLIALKQPVLSQLGQKVLREVDASLRLVLDRPRLGLEQTALNDPAQAPQT
jgi:predicted ATP-dependent endonuclease of OLD family